VSTVFVAQPARSWCVNLCQPAWGSPRSGIDRLPAAVV